ncbi:MAG: GNAT family N-acetyltransferase [Hyphomicrobiales bacterium]
MATTEADPSIKNLELAGFASWPAEHVHKDGTWLTRLSPQLPYKRTNSINCLRHSDGEDTAVRLEKALSVFRAANVQPTLRTTPLTPPELLAATSNAHWTEPFSESIVMTAQLAAGNGRQSSLNIQTLEEPVSEWIENFIGLTMDKTKDRTAITRTLNRIEKPVGFIRAVTEGVCAGVAVSVVQNDLVGLFGLAVSKAVRRQGLGRALSECALTWGATQGAKTAWLQVEADNIPARTLYDSLGFAERYRYAYRSLRA